MKNDLQISKTTTKTPIFVQISQDLIKCSFLIEFLMEMIQNTESVIKNHAKLLHQRLLPALGGSAAAPSSEHLQGILNATVEQELPAGQWQGLLAELTKILEECATRDSMKILEVEANIKSLIEGDPQQDKRILFMLAAVFSGSASSLSTASPSGLTLVRQIRQVAGIILKNSVKTYYPQIREKYNQELAEIEYVLLIMLKMHDAQVRVADFSSTGRKVYQELVLIIAQIVKKRFFEDAAMDNNDLLLSIIGQYQMDFSMTFLECLIQIFDQVDDDRVSKFVPELLKYSINHLDQEMKRENQMPLHKVKLLYFIQTLYKSLEWALNVDKQVIDNAVKDEETNQLFKLLLLGCFSSIPPQGAHPAQSVLQNPMSKFTFQFIEEKRLAAKLLTILIRDYQILKVLKQKHGYADSYNDAFRLSITNLVFFYPVFSFFNNNMTKDRYDSGLANEQIYAHELQNPQMKQFYAVFLDDDIDYEEIEQEVKSYVAQLMNLVQTVINMNQRDIQADTAAMYTQFINLTNDQSLLGQDKSVQTQLIVKQILYLMLGFCRMGANDIQQLEGTSAGGAQEVVDAQNAFLVNFLETDEDQFNQVSIRLSIVEFIEDLGLHDGTFSIEADSRGPKSQQSILSECVRSLYESSVTQQQQNEQQRQRVAQMLTNYTTLSQVDLMSDLALEMDMTEQSMMGQAPNQASQLQRVQLQEVALFIMGEFKEGIITMTTENEEFVERLVTEGLDLDNQNVHGLIVMRILWLLERIASHEQFFRENKDTKVQQIFEKLVDLFISPPASPQSCSTTFPVKYQCLRALYKYTKKIPLKQKYSEDQKYQVVLSAILSQICDNLLTQCNEDTIHSPIQALTYYSQIDEESTRLHLAKPRSSGSSQDPQAGGGMMQKIAQLFEKYHQDGLLGDDIVDLIKIHAAIPGNIAFKEVFLPMAQRVIEIFHQCVVGIGNAQGGTTGGAGAAVNQEQLSWYQQQAQNLIDENQLKSTLSIFNTYILKNKEFDQNANAQTGDDSEDAFTWQQSQKGNQSSSSGSQNQTEMEKQMYLSMFKMICEILNSYRDTYVNLHCVLTLGAFCKSLIVQKLYSEHIPTLKVLLSKLSNPNVGLDESSSLYLGHAILNLLTHCFRDASSPVEELVDPLLFNCILRVTKSSLPQVVKSYSLPLCYSFSARQKDLLPQIIMCMTQKDGRSTLIAFLDKLIKNFRHNNDQSGQDPTILHVQSLGLVALLEFTTQDLSFAALDVGGMQLQNALVYELANYLVRKEQSLERVEAKKKNPYGDEEGDMMYGDEDGADEDLYGDEYGGEDDFFGGFGGDDGFNELDAYGIDLADENLDPDSLAQNSSKREESALLEGLLMGAKDIQIVNKLKQSIRMVGQQSIQKIVSAAEDPQQITSSSGGNSDKFTERQKAVLNKIFE